MTENDLAFAGVNGTMDRILANLVEQYTRHFKALKKEILFRKTTIRYIDHRNLDPTQIEKDRRTVELHSQRMTQFLGKGTSFPLYRYVTTIEIYAAQEGIIKTDQERYLRAEGVNRRTGTSQKKYIQTAGSQEQSLGRYYQDTREIQLFSAFDFHTSAHEFAHAIYDQLLHKSEKNELCNAFEKVQQRVQARIMNGGRSLEEALEGTGLREYSCLSPELPQEGNTLYFGSTPVEIITVDTIKEMDKRTFEEEMKRLGKKLTMTALGVLRRSPEEAFADSVAFLMLNENEREEAGYGSLWLAEGKEWYGVVKRVLEPR